VEARSAPRGPCEIWISLYEYTEILDPLYYHAVSWTGEDLPDVRDNVWSEDEWESDPRDPDHEPFIGAHEEWAEDNWWEDHDLC
jgi:hypothetical protein